MSDPRIDEALRTMLPRLRRFALWLARDSNAADDLVQSTIERALSRWHTRREDESLRGWLFSILYRLFLDGKRRASRYARLLGSITHEEPTWPSAERVAVAHSTLAAFAALPVEQRWSRFLPDSELQHLNRNAGTWTAVSPVASGVLDYPGDDAVRPLKKNTAPSAIRNSDVEPRIGHGIGAGTE